MVFQEITKEISVHYSLDDLQNGMECNIFLNHKLIECLMCQQFVLYPQLITIDYCNFSDESTFTCSFQASILKGCIIHDFIDDDLFSISLYSLK